MTDKLSSITFAATMQKRSTWILILLLAFITFLQYAESLNLPAFISHINENIGLTRFSLERILYLLPIIWAGVLFGWRGGAIVATIAMICMLPRGIFISPHPEDAIVESIAVFIIGNAVAFSLESLRKERERRAQLEIAQQELKTQLHITEKSEMRLAALNETATIVSQSLELSNVLESAVNCVTDVMEMNIVLIYIFDEDNERLELAMHRGVSEKFVCGVRHIGTGEGFNGEVARSGKSMLIENASRYPELTRTAVREENIQSQVIVPMMAKGKVVGTISAAMRSYRQFDPAEVDLLTAIANQVGVAVDNARLYEYERDASEQLRSSEEKYRGLFENANDAIWLHDLEDNIIAANKACVQLTGYDLDELYNLSASHLIRKDSLETVIGMEDLLLNLNESGFRSEVKLIRKDGSEAVIELASSAMFDDGLPSAIQHIARDVTEEKRMRDNLQFFVQQVTRAQEEERKRIAQELHDDTIQALVVHSREIESLSSKLDQLSIDEIPDRLEELYAQSDVIINGVRRLSQDLRPAALDRLGLLPAVEWAADQTSEYSGVDINVEFIGEERRLPDEVELVLFRIAQEALRNVWKHAEATFAEVTVEFEEKAIRITVRDNGKGFDPPNSVADLPRYGMLGLVGMQERVRLLNGTLAFTSKLGEGTTVIAELSIYDR